MNLFCYLILIVIQVTSVLTTTCSSEAKRRTPKYYLVKKWHRSIDKLNIAARANYVSLTSCQRLGIEKKALALNFSPHLNFDNTEEYSCEVLKCPEISGGTSLRNDSRYHYYSLYAKPIPHVNTTCLPATGMFHLLNTRLTNSTQAHLSCNNRSGVLADVTSEQSTDALSQLLAGTGVLSAFVGLQRNAQKFYTTYGDSLACSTYRAWAPGHPRRNKAYNCVVLTQQHMWRSVPCRTASPSLCELIPGGPYRRGSLVQINKESNHTTLQQ